ncbi:hypothetical protein ACFVUY_38065 [Kitasatospora sp. NPDC058063]|uniref:hypothetical protein n=1 Tax=unclassified Kitasatospora TaxID=2633591 RepID=UPI0036DCA05D
MRVHVLAYLAKTPTGIEQGLARIPSDRDRPSWAECAAQIPGFLISSYLGPAPEPTYTLRYETETGRHTKTLNRAGVERVGRIASRAADRGELWNIEVLDLRGADVTDEFACFA